MISYYDICNFAKMHVFSIYLELADIRYLEEVLNCKNFSKVNFKNADTYKVRIYVN